MNLGVQSNRHRHHLYALDHKHLRYFYSASVEINSIPLGPYLLCVANEILFYGTLFYGGYSREQTIEMGTISTIT